MQLLPSFARLELGLNIFADIERMLRSTSGTVQACCCNRCRHDLAQAAGLFLRLSRILRWSPAEPPVNVYQLRRRTSRLVLFDFGGGGGAYRRLWFFNLRNIAKGGMILSVRAGRLTLNKIPNITILQQEDGDEGSGPACRNNDGGVDISRVASLPLYS